MTAYYNEHDKQCAQWLRNLIDAGLIAPGVVDDRSIEDVRPADLRRFTQCHFFAGIGVWSYALRRAGWPDGRPVWTGSCPCQPFSTAGTGAGFADERHLWPYWYHLIQQCSPAVVLGEQVASKDGLAWLDLVHADLEDEAYAFAPADLCAAGVGAPHLRQRLYWVADADGTGQPGSRRPRCFGAGYTRSFADNGGVLGALADADDRGRQEPGLPAKFIGRSKPLPGRGGEDGGPRTAASRCGASGPVEGFWVDADWIACRDGKARPVEPDTFPLAHGAPARVVRLRAYGNAIVAPLAEEFIRSYLEVQTIDLDDGLGW